MQSGHVGPHGSRCRQTLMKKLRQLEPHVNLREHPFQITKLPLKLRKVLQARRFRTCCRNPDAAMKLQPLPQFHPIRILIQFHHLAQPCRSIVFRSHTLTGLLIQRVSDSSVLRQTLPPPAANHHTKQQHPPSDTDPFHLHAPHQILQAEEFTSAAQRSMRQLARHLKPLMSRYFSRISNMIQLHRYRVSEENQQHQRQTDAQSTNS